jgi:hypothetical protein
LFPKPADISLQKISEEKLSHHIRFVNIKRTPNVVAGSLGLLLSFFILFDGFNVENIRILAIISIPVWIFLILDSAMPNKFLISESEFGIKHSLFWRKWNWEDLESLSFVPKKWLGLDTYILTIKTQNGEVIELEETRFFDNKKNPKKRQKITKLEKIFSKQLNNTSKIKMS